VFELEPKEARFDLAEAKSISPKAADARAEVA